MNVQPELIGGRSDAAPLTKRGEAQARALGRRLLAAGARLDSVYSSTAVRARRTAELACEAASLEPSEVRETPEVLELCQGEWTGRSRREVYTPEVLKRICEDPLFFRAPGVAQQDAPPGGRAPAGESQWDVEERMAGFVEALLQRPPPGQGSVLSGDGEGVPTVAVFSHGLAIRCFLRRVLGACPGFAVHSEMGNTAITEVLYRPGEHNLDGWRVVRMNDAAHLEGLDA